MEIRVCNDAGRLLRPLLRVRNNLPLLKRKDLEMLRNGELKWDDLITDGKLDEAVLEYIDAGASTRDGCNGTKAACRRDHSLQLHSL